MGTLALESGDRGQGGWWHHVGLSGVQGLPWASGRPAAAHLSPFLVLPSAPAELLSTLQVVLCSQIKLASPSMVVPGDPEFVNHVIVTDFKSNQL